MYCCTVEQLNNVVLSFSGLLCFDLEFLGLVSCVFAPTAGHVYSLGIAGLVSCIFECSLSLLDSSILELCELLDIDVVWTSRPLLVLSYLLIFIVATFRALV